MATESQHEPRGTSLYRGGVVVLRDGEATDADVIWTCETHVGYRLGPVVRKVPWDRVKHIEKHVEVADDAE